MSPGWQVIVQGGSRGASRLGQLRMEGKCVLCVRDVGACGCVSVYLCVSVCASALCVGFGAVCASVSVGACECVHLVRVLCVWDFT